MHNRVVQPVSVSQHGQSALPAAPIIMESQSCMGTAETLPSPPTARAVACAIAMAIPWASLAHAAVIGAKSTATATSTERMARQGCNAGSLLRSKSYYHAERSKQTCVLAGLTPPGRHVCSWNTSEVFVFDRISGGRRSATNLGEYRYDVRLPLSSAMCDACRSNLPDVSCGPRRNRSLYVSKQSVLMEERTTIFCTQVVETCRKLLKPTLSLDTD